MTVYDLNREQLIELKQSYLVQLDDCGELEEIVGINEISYEVLANADEIVSDDFIFEHYDGVYFVEDDFTSN